MKLVELIIDKKEDVGVFAVSLVEKPAIKRLFVKFADETEKVIVKFAVDQEKHVITGPFMIPDQRIYRSAESLGMGEESMVYFSKESIRNASEQFLAQNYTNSVTLQHESATNGLTLAQSWIIDDPEHDKATLYGFSDLPAGTWMGSFIVNDPEIWSKIEDGTYAGFSIEAFFIPRVTNQDVPYEFSEEVKQVQDEFLISRSANDTKESFVSRCIAQEVASGMEADQAAAVCYAKWDAYEEERFTEEFLDLIVEWVASNKPIQTL